ncbi:MAG: hypothetical protein M4D85_05770 [Actinomycetota bacterium]|nr:hypothetical protein [Actinomycetota bacterium]
MTRTIAALIALALLGAGVAGCSSGTTTPTAAPSVGQSLPSFGSLEEPDVPENFMTYDGGAYSFAYPEEWELVERQGSDGPVVVVEGPVTSAGLPQQFIVATQDNYAGDMDLVVNAFDFVRTLPEQEVLRDERVAFMGEVEAQVTDRTFDAPTASGQARARTLELRLITAERLLVATSARTSSADFEASPLPVVFDSFRLAT